MRTAQLYFQDPSTFTMSYIIHLHDYISYYVVALFLVVIYLLFYILEDTLNKDNIFSNILKRDAILRMQNFTHSARLEKICIIIPSIILFNILLYSFYFLYTMDGYEEPFVTVKVIGHQWYWSYEITRDSAWAVGWGKTSDGTYYSKKVLTLDCYPIADTELMPTNFRLLDTNFYLRLPINTEIRFIVTANDVLHSFSIPSAGIKLDAVPGRLNQVIVNFFKSGMYYGLCSELCGVGHSIMPIKFEVASLV